MAITGHRFWRMAPAGVALAVLLVLSVSKRAEAQDGPIWIRQFGTADYDYVRSLAIDGSGNVYTSGWTFGDLGGPQQGGGDTWVAKYSAAGVRLWTRQLGSAAEDNAFTMAADPAGTVYVSGRTNGALAGPYRGQGDVWIAAYDPAGRPLWTRQRGTPAYEGSYGMALDGRGNLYITGYTTGAFAGAHTGGGDAYLLKYSTAGTALWSRQLGTPARDLAWADAVAADGTIYVAGDTEGSLAAASQGASDVFLARYSPAGALLWVRQFGSAAEEQTRGTAADRAGNVYVAGWTSGALAGPSSGKTDAFLAKYSAGGVRLWTKQLGTAGDDHAEWVATGADGNAYIGGSTTGRLTGSAAAAEDAFLAKYAPNGQLLWVRQWGTRGYDDVRGMAVLGSTDLFAAGRTAGVLGGTHPGRVDTWVARFSTR